MSFADYWNRLKSRNAKLSDDDTNMTLSVASFRRQLEKAHEAGAEEGQQFMRDMGRLKDQGKPKNPFGDLFGDIFGGGGN
jgi:hypothetical protein